MAEFKASSWACTYLRMVNAAPRCPNHADIADRVYVMVEIRTVAGPSRALQCVERRPVHRLIACAARPRGVAAAVAEASLAADEDLADAELVPRWGSACAGA